MSENLNVLNKNFQTLLVKRLWNNNYLSTTPSSSDYSVKSISKPTAFCPAMIFMANFVVLHLLPLTVYFTN